MPDGGMEAETVGETLQTRGLSHRDHTRFARVNGTYRLKGPAVASGARPKGRTLAQPFQARMASDLIDTALADGAKAVDDSLGMNGRTVSREPTISGEKAVPIRIRRLLGRQLPRIEAILALNLGCGGEVPYGVQDRSGLSLLRMDILQRDRVASRSIHADHEQTSSFRRCSEISGVEQHRSEQIVLSSDPFQGGIKHRPRVGVAQTFDVLHDKERWRNLRDQTKEVVQQISAWIVDLAMPNVAERLTRGAAKYAEDIASSQPADILASRLGKIAERDPRLWKIGRERRREDGIDVEREFWPKAGRSRAERETAAPAEQIDHPRLCLHQKPLWADYARGR